MKKRKNTTIQTTLSLEDYDRFVGHVKAIDRSVAEVLREAVNLYMEHLDKKEALPLDYDDVEERRISRHLWGA